MPETLIDDLEMLIVMMGLYLAARAGNEFVKLLKSLHE